MVKCAENSTENSANQFAMSAFCTLRNTPINCPFYRFHLLLFLLPRNASQPLWQPCMVV